MRHMRDDINDVIWRKTKKCDDLRDIRYVFEDFEDVTIAKYHHPPPRGRHVSRLPMMIKEGTTTDHGLPSTFITFFTTHMTGNARQASTAPTLITPGQKVPRTPDSPSPYVGPPDRYNVAMINERNNGTKRCMIQAGK